MLSLSNAMPMKAERAEKRPSEETSKRGTGPVPASERAAPGRLRPDLREDKLGKQYHEEQAALVNEIADLRSGKDEVMAAYDKELERLSKELLEASATDPYKVDEISEGIAELQELRNEHRTERQARIAGLESRLRDVNGKLNPLQDLSQAEMEKALSDITFAEPISEAEAEKALAPLKESEIVEVTDDMIEPLITERHGKVGKGRLTEEQKAAVRKEHPRRPSATPADGLPPERVPGARAASMAEYELTGDELEIEEDTPTDEKKALMTKAEFDAELDALFAQAEKEPSEVLPALSREAQAAQELGDEKTIREEVDMLAAQIKELHQQGFSQQNLDRLMDQKGVDPDRRAASGAYRALTRLRSLFDPKLRLLLEIYDKKTSELADLRDRYTTGQLRLKDPEAYRKLMEQQKRNIRNLREKR